VWPGLNPDWVSPATIKPQEEGKMKFGEAILRFIRIAIAGGTAMAGTNGIDAVAGTALAPETQTAAIWTLVVAFLTAAEKFIRDNQMFWGKAFPSKEAKPPAPPQ